MSDDVPPSSPRDFELIRTALSFYEDERFDFAVVALHSATEIYFEERISTLIQWRELGSLGDVILDVLVRNYRLTDGRAQALWQALTGARIGTVKHQSWWDGYVLNGKLRDQVVHRGGTPSKNEVEGCIEGSLGSLDYMNRTTIRIGKELGAIHEVGTPRPRLRRLPVHDRG